jgi:uncharacterized protein YbjT (DUF2867 family)
MSITRKILISGATGKQGGATLKYLSQLPGNKFELLALTRNANSPSALKLAQTANVKIVEGDLDNVSAIFEKTGPVWGVFAVQTVSKKEEAQGKDLVDAAVAAGTEYFVYSSVDRGGPQKSEGYGTYVPHFVTKYHIENHLKEKASASKQGMAWTILRPVAFMDNYAANFPGKGFGAAWKSLGDKKLQVIYSGDIGAYAALAFENPEKYQGQALSIAGDELSFAEAQEVFKDAFDSELPYTYGFVATALKTLIADVGLMFKWFEEVGYGSNIQEARKIYPGLMDFKTWLTTTSGFKKD